MQVRKRTIGDGFTLVEILVAIAIIGILSALTTVVVLRAVRSASVSECAAHLSQIHKATKLYAIDYDDRTPPYPFVSFQDQDARQADFKQALLTYGATDRLWYCPLDTHKGTDFLGEWHSFRYTSYTVGPMYPFVSVIDKNGYIDFSFGNVQDPSGFALFLDQTILSHETEGSEVKIQRTSAHVDTINVVYADGHTKALKTPKP